MKTKTIYTLIICFILISNLMADNTKLNVQVNANVITHQMKGGIGASWHTLIHEIPLNNEKYEYPVSMVNQRGSAFAGNPPLNDTTAWNQLYKHAKWLGLNFVRVEIDMRMYEPQKDIFDWNNDEMQALYRILNWCEANHADVFLQQMWGHVEWNAHGGVHPLLSSPKSLDDFSKGIATLLKHLSIDRKYTCIKYFSMTNEPPGGTWGYWWCSGSKIGPTITDAWQKLSETFKKENLNIILSGPDWTSLPPCEPEKMDFAKYLGSFDIHSYRGIYSNENGVKRISDWVKFAEKQNKPFFITEFGNFNLGWGNDSPNPKSFKAALSNASDVALCMNLGVDGFNRWSFTNRGNMDGQWQLVKTYDIPTKTYIKNISPENEAYYGFAMLSRFLGKYTSVLSCKSDSNMDSIVVTAFKNKDGNVSVLVVNNKKMSIDFNIKIENSINKQSFYLYQVTENLLGKSDFRLDPARKLSCINKSNTIILLPESITIISSYQKKQEDFGVIE